MTVLFALAGGCRVWGADEPQFLQQMLNLQRFQALCRWTNDCPPIRVMIYGQSITGQPWTTQMVGDVQARFPGHQWNVVNRCLSGTPSQDLIYSTDADVFPFNPDLIIFHCYGDTNLYAQIIAHMRARTTSDILIINDHYVHWDSLSDPGIGLWDGQVLPDIALLYGACMADIRTPWKEYLVTHNLPISALTLDGLHPNATGQALLRQYAGAYAHGPSLQPSPDPYNCPRALRVKIPSDARASGIWQLPFTGTRVTARVGAGDASILVDGVPPSGLVGGAVHTRSSLWPGTGWWPALRKVDCAAPMLPERWKVHIDKLISSNSFQFSVTGSVTGPDGSGSTAAEFRSTSGRVVIEPVYWWWNGLVGTLTNGMEFTWNAVATGADSVHRSAGASATW
ncbi:MAG TPA: hypothetical protein VF607_11970, partial [Verrucomicrobiae bacterium]